jgi:hypothetical protein
MKLNPVLEVEASVIGKDGKIAPLAGQTFYILEKSPISILRANDPLVKFPVLKHGRAEKPCG